MHNFIRGNWEKFLFLKRFLKKRFLYIFFLDIFILFFLKIFCFLWIQKYRISEQTMLFEFKLNKNNTKTQNKLRCFCKRDKKKQIGNKFRNLHNWRWNCNVVYQSANETSHPIHPIYYLYILCSIFFCWPEQSICRMKRFCNDEYTATSTCQSRLPSVLNCKIAIWRWRCCCIWEWKKIYTLPTGMIFISYYIRLIELKWFRRQVVFCDFCQEI